MNKHSPGGGQNTYKLNPLFKDIKEYNKYLLSLICIFILVLTGIISYNYTNTSYAKWNSSVESNNILKLSVKVPNTDNSGANASEFAKTNVGTNGLELITHEIDDSLEVDERFATEYRYIGNDLDTNYVWFNCSDENNKNETTCERWRIIGIIPTDNTTGNVENRFKILREESLGDMYWNEEDDLANDWITSSLNTYLNTEYYNSIYDQDMIGPTKYYLGSGYNANDISLMWQYERIGSLFREGFVCGTNAPFQNDSDKKIALMNASDYFYIANGDYSTPIWNLENIWMLNQTLIADLCAVDGNHTDIVCYQEKHSVYPVVTLASTVVVTGGDGSYDAPYELSMMKNTFSFMINDTEYYAYEGMRWDKWIKSNFNGNNFIINEEGCITTIDGSPILLNTSWGVYATDEVQEDHYVFETIS